jgi:hypothetical protein
MTKENKKLIIILFRTGILGVGRHETQGFLGLSTQYLLVVT